MKLVNASTPTTIAIETDIDRAAGVVLADPTRIHQILMNLCTNANHAMREDGGTMRVELGRIDLAVGDAAASTAGLSPGRYVRIRVADTGHGMDRETLQKVFDPYFTTKSRGEGTGLGLSVVHGTVARLGGAVIVDSVPDSGTTFDVYLPRVDTEADAPDADDCENLPGGDETILIVDDEPMLQEVISGMLETLGYTVIACGKGAEALALHDTDPQRVDLIITDQIMPEMTGIELAERLNAKGAMVPVVLHTGFISEIPTRRLAAAGVRFILKKPIVLRELAEKVRDALDWSL